MSGTTATPSTGGGNGGVAVDETDRLIASDKVEGTAVYDRHGNTGRGGYVVDATREQLERAPTYARDEAPWSRPDYGRDVYSHYGLPYGSGV